MKKDHRNNSIIQSTARIISYLSILNFLFFINLFFNAQFKVYGQIAGPELNEYKDSLFVKNDTILIDSHPDLILPLFQLIDKDTISLGANDELIFDHYTAIGKPGVYDALHSFNYRRSDRFGGYINEKVNAGLERVRQKGFKSDIKKLFIQINPLTLTVYWFAIVGPSRDGFSYVRIDSRGSAGGYLSAVQKQLPRMHKLYPDLNPVKFLEFNEDVIVCYTWDGKMLDNYCYKLNIMQHFFKYYNRIEINDTLISESKLDLIFSEKYETDKVTFDSIVVQDLNSQNLESKVINKNKIIKRPCSKIYKVKKGDTLSEIAQKHNTSVTLLKKANKLKNDNIRIGQILKII
jgi:hypothetical protein